LNGASTATISSPHPLRSASSASHALPNAWIHPCPLFEFHFAFAVAEVGLRQKMPPRFSDQLDTDTEPSEGSAAPHGGPVNYGVARTTCTKTFEAFDMSEWLGA
jgi:hypothetical protein